MGLKLQEQTGWLGKKKKDLMRRPVTYFLRFILLTAVASNPRQIDPGLPEVAAGRAQRSAPRCCLSNPSRGQKEHVAKLEINSELLIHSFIHSVSVLIWPLQTRVREWQMTLVFTLTVPSNQWEFRCLNRNQTLSCVPGSGALPCPVICLSQPLKRPCRLVLLLFFGFLG